MTTEPQLESYLARLDKSLGQIPIGARAEIITEIKSHVLEARERQPEKTLGSVLESLGEPETVANRYLLERGLSPVKAGRSPMVKWLTIGFLGTMGIGCLTTLLLVWKFSPLIQVDEGNDRVSILGGMINVAGGTFQGEKDAAKFSALRIPFSNAKIEISQSTDGKVHWRCKVMGDDGASATEEGKTFVLDLEHTGGSKCEIEIPAKLKSIVRGDNGKLTIVKPQADVDVEMDNGKISVTPDPTRAYHYDTKVTNGMVHGLKSSDAKDAVRIRLALTNGKISAG
jgi:hypothetical protein